MHRDWAAMCPKSRKWKLSEMVRGRSGQVCNVPADFIWGFRTEIIRYVASIGDAEVGEVGQCAAFWLKFMDASKVSKNAPEKPKVKVARNGREKVGINPHSLNSLAFPTPDRCWQLSFSGFLPYFCWISMHLEIKHIIFFKGGWYSKNRKNVGCRQEQLKVSQRFVFLLFVLFMSKIWFNTRFLMWWIGKVVCCWFSEMLNLSSLLGFISLRNNVCLALKHKT